MPIDRGFCIKCKVRKARYAHGTCIPCNSLINAEGTHELYGVKSKRQILREQHQARATEYNALIKKRMSQKAIAKLWGWPMETLRTQVHRWKSIWGIKVIPGWANRINTATSVPEATSRIRLRRNGHGEGRTGVARCRCDPCMEVRRASSKDANSAYRAAKRQKIAQEKKHGKKKPS